MRSTILRSTQARIATLFIVLQAGLLYSSVRTEATPESRPLSEFPHALGGWRFAQENVVDSETRSILNADDLVDRFYLDSSSKHGAELFVASFKSQRNGKSPHSPKNCLPGSGWTPLLSDYYTIDVSQAGGEAQPIVVNRYIVEHGDARSVVLYWYQSRQRVVASEFKAKLWVMTDAVRLNRTDTALVRVVVNIDQHNPDKDQATQTAVDFVKSFFGPLHQYLPA